MVFLLELYAASEIEIGAFQIIREVGLVLVWDYNYRLDHILSSRVHQ